MYDYGARFYDPTIGRWTTPDPLEEWQFNFTPYQYARNNPMRFIDPNGLYDLDQVDVYGKKPSWLKRMFREIGNLFKPGNGDSRSGGGIPLVTSENSIDPTKDKAKHPDREVNIDDLLPAMTVPGSIPSGPLLGAEIIGKLSQASQEIWSPKSGAKPTSDKKILEEHGGSQKTKTDNTGKLIKADTNTKYEGLSESDSIVQEYTVLFDSKNGDVRILKKEHKNTHMGRVVSKEYRVKND